MCLRRLGGVHSLDYRYFGRFLSAATVGSMVLIVLPTYVSQALLYGMARHTNSTTPIMEKYNTTFDLIVGTEGQTMTMWADMAFTGAFVLGASAAATGRFNGFGIEGSPLSTALALVNILEMMAMGGCVGVFLYNNTNNGPATAILLGIEGRLAAIFIRNGSYIFSTVAKAIHTPLAALIDIIVRGCANASMRVRISQSLDDMLRLSALSFAPALIWLLGGSIVGNSLYIRAWSANNTPTSDFTSQADQFVIASGYWQWASNLLSFLIGPIIMLIKSAIKLSIPCRTAALALLPIFLMMWDAFIESAYFFKVELPFIDPSFNASDAQDAAFQDFLNVLITWKTLEQGLSIAAAEIIVLIVQGLLWRGRQQQYRDSYLDASAILGLDSHIRQKPQEVELDNVVVDTQRPEEDSSVSGNVVLSSRQSRSRLRAPLTGVDEEAKKEEAEQQPSANDLEAKLS